MDTDMYTTYVYALSSVTLISLAPIFVLFLLPVDNKLNLKKLLALAAGCLLGDAFLHLIPEGSHGIEQAGHEHEHHHDHHDHDHSRVHEHNHHHDHQDGLHHHSHDHSVGLKVLAGIMLFFVLEKIIYSIKTEEPAKNVSRSSSKSKNKKNDDHDDSRDEEDHHDHIHPSGILNLFADFLHNITDGLAIGASFLAGTTIGVSTTFAIFLHEVPHEIGDYAILVQSGFSKQKAIWLQALTALGAVSGTVLSLLIGSYDERTNQWILPFTAGGFIYIATVHLIPQLKSSDFKQTIIELLFFIAGVAMMYMMSWLE